MGRAGRRGAHPLAICLRLLLALLILGGVAGAGASAASAAASPWFTTEQGRLRLIAAAPATPPPAPPAGAALALGLEFRLAPGWKIYWRSPGDAGYPPSVDWRGSSNLAGTEIRWPAPRRFSVSGIETVGYEEGLVVLPIEARRIEAGSPVHLAALVDYLTCKEICVPYQASLALDLPGPSSAGDAGAGGGAAAALIAAAAARVPGDGRTAGLALAGAEILPGTAPMLRLRVLSATPLLRPDAFVEGPAGIAFGPPEPVRRDGAASLLSLPVLSEPGAAHGLVGHRLTVTLVDGDRTMEGVVTPAEGATASDLATLLPMLALALLGGFILNFMPCVLPVLSLKLLGAVGHASPTGASRAQLRLGFLATAAGIFLAFIALALVLLALRASGAAVGWGVQFQQPSFLVVMVAVLTLFALNLWGRFEIPLPSWLAGIGMAGSGRGPLLGNLATGAFATLLATPCSAPYLGTAIGFAFAGGPREILTIFPALAVGFALPYLAVAAVPRLALLLPRPGRWMLGLRRVLGVVLLGTAAWLVAVLAAEAGLAVALGLALLMAVLAAVFAALPKPAPRRVALAVILPLALALPLLGAPPAAPGAARDALWRPFDRAAIDGLVRQGHVVFVDVTADWCLTCQVNERFVLETAPVHDRLAGSGTVAMRADWTRPDPAIADYLHGFGRYGIPFNIVYGPAAPSGLPLPELLSASAVMSLLDKAAGDRRPPGERSLAGG